MADEEESMCFFDPNFINAHPLTTGNILEYFSLSKFYDKQSLNEILKMQSQFANIDISGKLTSTVGVYYILEFQADNLFVIGKKENDGQSTRILKMYYCMFGYIYCAPTHGRISDSRMMDALFYLNEAIDKYEEIKTFHWLEGFKYREYSRDGEENQEEAKFLFEVLHDFGLKR